MKNQVDIDRNVGFLAAVTFLRDSEREDLEVIAKHVERRELKPGDFLFREGELGDFMGFIIDGKVDVLKERMDGKNVVIASLPGGRVIGEVALIDRAPRSASIRASGAVNLLTLSQENFEQLMDRYPRVGLYILKWLCTSLCQNLRQQTAQSS